MGEFLNDRRPRAPQRRAKHGRDLVWPEAREARALRQVSRIQGGRHARCHHFTDVSWRDDARLFGIEQFEERLRPYTSELLERQGSMLRVNSRGSLRTAAFVALLCAPSLASAQTAPS